MFSHQKHWVETLLDPRRKVNWNKNHLMRTNSNLKIQISPSQGNIHIGNCTKKVQNIYHKLKQSVLFWVSLSVRTHNALNVRYELSYLLYNMSTIFLWIILPPFQVLRNIQNPLIYHRPLAFIQITWKHKIFNTRLVLSSHISYIITQIH